VPTFSLNRIRKKKLMVIVLSGMGIIVIFIGLSLIYAEARGSISVSTKFRDFIEKLGQVVLIIGLVLEAISILI
jgi:hypothetical protein